MAPNQGLNKQKAKLLTQFVILLTHLGSFRTAKAKLLTQFVILLTHLGSFRTAKGK
jgi:hypothetical protein